MTARVIDHPLAVHPSRREAVARIVLHSIAAWCILVGVAILHPPLVRPETAIATLFLAALLYWGTRGTLGAYSEWRSPLPFVLLILGAGVALVLIHEWSRLGGVIAILVSFLWFLAFFLPYLLWQRTKLPLGAGPLHRLYLELLKTCVLDDSLAFLSLVSFPLAAMVGLFSPEVKGKLSTDLSFLLAFFTLAIQAMVRLFTRFWGNLFPILNATHQRILHNAVGRLHRHSVVIGYGDLGTRVVRDLVCQSPRKRRPPTLILPLAAQELGADVRDGGRGGLPTLVEAPLYADVLIADRDSTPFIGVVRITSEVSLGLAYVRLPRQVASGGFGFVPAIIGDINKRTVLEACHVRSARLVINTAATEQVTQTLLAEYSDLFKSRDGGRE